MIALQRVATRINMMHFSKFVCALALATACTYGAAGPIPVVLDTDIGDDIDDARIYGGIHFRFDQEAGARRGREVATSVYENNLQQGNLSGYACFLVAQENVGTLATKGSDNVRFERNTIENCGSQATGHGGALIYSDGAQAHNNIVLLNNDFRQSGQAGIRAYNNYTYGLRLENNRISGASPAYSVSTANATVIPYTSGAVGYVAP